MHADRIRLLFAIVIPMVVWFTPTDLLPITGLTETGHRVLAIFALAVTFWILEPIPIFATSVLVTVLGLLTVSDGGIGFLVAVPADPVAATAFGPLVKSRDLMATFADPVIMLFLGGFFLAAAATKYQLDTNLARVLIRPFGTRPTLVILGMMVITAVFSMFMSNTACTAMMLAVLAPVMAAMPEGDRGRIAMALSIPFAANIGGMGTPIGTPPNAVAMKYLTGEHAIGFGTWMAFAIPYVVVLLGLAWLVLMWLYRPQAPAITLRFEGRFQRSARAVLVYLGFALTIGLWVTEQLHGMSASVVAMLPVALFCATGVITAKDLKGMSWDVLWLIAGGFALSVAMTGTGLSRSIVDSIPFATMPPLAILLVATLVTATMATFMSNTATANLLLPLMATVGLALGGALDDTGGYTGLILSVTFAASLAMILPISTPPNAMAHATGMCSSRDMAVSGLLICLIGLVLAWALLIILHRVQFI